MSAQETIEASLAPLEKPKRLSPQEKARSLLETPAPTQSQGTEVAVLPAALPVKFSTRILPEQLQWLRDRIADYTRNHPRPPRLLMEELAQIAIFQIMKADDLEALIKEHRS